MKRLGVFLKSNLINKLSVDAIDLAVFVVFFMVTILFVYTIVSSF